MIYLLIFIIIFYIIIIYKNRILSNKILEYFGKTRDTPIDWVSKELVSKYIDKSPFKYIKLNLKIFYKSDDNNSVGFTQSSSNDNTLRSLLSSNNINTKCVSITYKDCDQKISATDYNYNYKYENLEHCFFEEIFPENYKLDNIKLIRKNLKIPDLLDKTPKLFLFFQKHKDKKLHIGDKEDVIVVYNGVLNLDKFNKFKDTKENILLFLEDTIEKNLLLPKKLSNYEHEFTDPSLKLNLLNNTYTKCNKCSYFIKK